MAGKERDNFVLTVCTGTQVMNGAPSDLSLGVSGAGRMVRKSYPVERNEGRWVWVDPPPVPHSAFAFPGWMHSGYPIMCHLESVSVKIDNRLFVSVASVARRPACCSSLAGQCAVGEGAAKATRQFWHLKDHLGFESTSPGRPSSSAARLPQWSP